MNGEYQTPPPPIQTLIYQNFSVLLCSWKIETLFLKLKDQKLRTKQF